MLPSELPPPVLSKFAITTLSPAHVSIPAQLALTVARLLAQRGPECLSAHPDHDRQNNHPSAVWVARAEYSIDPDNDKLLGFRQS
jgi:hypothetical protein